MIEESLPPNPKALLRTWVRGFRGERREERGELRGELRVERREERGGTGTMPSSMGVRKLRFCGRN
jgi:hypothetical protein